MIAVEDILKAIGELSNEDREKLISLLVNYEDLNSSALKEFITNENFVDGKVCPHCASFQVTKNGRRKDGTQRYMCKNCKKSFIATSNTITYGTKKSFYVWKKYVNCMMHGFSLRKTAEICDINLNTAFAWRHKILDALQNMASSVKLGGIVEADEIFFSVSYKGNHSKSKTFTMPREARHSGKQVHVRGLSKEKVCVACGVTRDGLSIAKVSNLGRASNKEDLEKVFGSRILPNSVLCADGLGAYDSVSKNAGAELKKFTGTTAKDGIYNIQHINSYHSELKHFMNDFKGVSTKYLNNYLIWHNLVNYAKGSFQEKETIFYTFVLTTGKQMSKT